MDQSENTTKRVPAMPANLPSRPWRAGQARPALSLAFGTQDMAFILKGAVSVTCNLAMAGSFALKNLAGISLVGDKQETAFYVALTIGGFYFASSAGAAAEQWLARSGAVHSLSMAGRAGALVAAIGVVDVMEDLRHFSAAAWKAAAKFSRKADPKRDLGSIPEPIAVAAAPASPKRSGLAARSENLKNRLAELRQDTAGLSEKGAWRLARHYASKGKAVEAAQVWLASPFNPDWGICSVGAGAWSNSRTGMPFGEWIAKVAPREAEASDREFLSEASGLMLAAKDGLAIAVACKIGAVGRPPAGKKMRL